MTSRYLNVLGAITAAALTTSISMTAANSSEFGVLVQDKGVEETFAYCSACHSERLVAQQGLTREGWSELMEWMIEEQGMAPIEEPDRTLVLDYLSKNYGVDRPNFPKR